MAGLVCAEAGWGSDSVAQVATTERSVIRNFIAATPLVDDGIDFERDSFDHDTD
jgi:hypothetical protein